MLQLARDKLSYPAGVAPGFNPTHVAGAAPRLSAVASAGGAFINLLNGKGAALTGPAQGSLSAAGPVNAVGAGTTADNQQFDGSNTFADTAATFGCILIPGSGDMTGGNAFFTDSNAGSGFSLWLGDLEGRTGGVIPQNNATTFPDGGAAVVANVPHFICVVFDGVNNTYTLTKNLATGLVQFGVFTTAGGGTLSTASGTPFKIGNGWNIASPSHSKIAAVALSGKAISPAAMRAWADDPWSFWYPNSALIQDNLVGAGGAISVGITGAGCSAQAGSVAITDNFVITGASVAAQAGAVATTESQTVSGAQAAAQAGAVSVTLSPSIAISGAQASASAGTVAITESHSLTGAQVAAQAGSVADTVSVSVTGAQAAAQAGSVAETIQIAITGAGVTAQAGAVSVSGSISVSITGAQVTALAGSASVSGSPSVPISGAQAAAQAGTVSETISKTLTGAQAAAQAGSVSEAVSTSIAGAQAVAQSGVVADIISKALAGAQVAAQAGSVAETVAALIQGALASAQAGSASVLAFGPISISGAAVIAQAGIVSILNPSNTLPFQQASIKAFETTPSLKGYEIDPSLKGY